jgi:hypothetical protein
MSHYLIPPNTTSIPLVDTYLCVDHQPPPTFTVDKILTLEQSKAQWVGKNTIKDLLDKAGTTIDQHFFIFDHYCYLESFENNSCFVPDFLIRTMFSYSNRIVPSIDFSKKRKQVSCPMNKLRFNRVLASCYFANQTNTASVNYSQSWTESDAEQILYELLQLGELNNWANTGVPVRQLDKYFIPETALEQQRKNIDLYLDITSNIILPSAISIVLEPIFWESGCIITEKYLNAIYSGTIPVVDGYRVYECLEAMGFDTFSDIIDTSSQYEKNPILRVWNMLQDNQTVFDSGLDLINQPEIQQRILNNIKHAQQPAICLKNFLERRNSAESIEKFCNILKTESTDFCQKSLEVYLNYNK